jgi:hypothetical protein
MTMTMTIRIANVFEKMGESFAKLSKTTEEFKFLISEGFKFRIPRKSCKHLLTKSKSKRFRKFGA